MLSLFASVALAFSTPTPVANIHRIYCTEGQWTYQGTGWFIRDGVMATALHVVKHDTCKDATTGEVVKAYKTDSNHDFALMSGSHSKSVMNYTCNRPKPGRTYISYGYSSDYKGGDFWNPLFQVYLIKATKNRPILVWGLWNIYPYREYEGSIMHGMSGGPVADSKGVAYALNNAGDDDTTLLYDLADTALCTGKWD